MLSTTRTSILRTFKGFRCYAALSSVWIGSTFGSSIQAATIAARSAAYTDVSTAIGLAADGDTVTVPAGTATWAATLTISKAITLQGAGIGQTIILDGLAKEGNNIQFQTTKGKYYRLTGFEFRPGTRTVQFGKGCALFNGSTKTFRVDHCKFDQLYNRCLYFRGSVCGVVDHCTFTNPRSEVFTIFHDAWPNPDGRPGSWGDGSWATPLDWGGLNAIYFEDNNLSKVGDTFGVLDQYGGARFVFRYNTVTNGVIASHGTGSTGRYRGLRQWEIYGNTLTANPKTAKNALHIRSGTGVVFNNTIVGYGKTATLHTYRYHTAFPDWPGSDGLCGWDNNDPTLYIAGNAGSGSKNFTLVVTGANWTPDQWVGYSVRDTASSTLYPRGFHSAITANTRDTITVEGGSQIVDKPFAVGDHFEIHKVLQGLDMIGGSTGDLLDPSATPSAKWLRQSLEPAYFWNNTFNGKINGGIAIATDPPIKEGVHFFNNQAKPNYTPLPHPHPLAASILPPSNLTIAGP